MKPRPQPRISPLALSLALAILAANAQAGEGTVTHGSAEISRDANGNTTIRQNSSRAIINWNDFSINAGKWMQFLQPGKDSAVLNRVLGGDPSRIFGEIRANGQVFVINPNGVVIGPTGVIQAAAFMASTLDVDPNAFMAGNPLRFSGDSHSAIRNLGFIRTTAGDVILVGRSVENAGGIEAGQGRAALIAANAVRLDPQGGNIVVEAGLDGGGTGVDNSGTIRAAQAQLSAAGGNVYALAINAGGTIEATGVENRDGRILLTSGGGDIRVDGTLKARNADGSGGTILVGGDKQGRNPEIPNAGNVTVGANALLDADAGTQGDGGKVVVWSDGRTDFAGHISARGGAEGGDGGFAEVSGKYLVMNGLADLRAAHGTFGTLLLDPDDIVIDTDLAAGGNHVTGSTSYLSAADIATQLGLGNLTVNTASANTAAGNITLQGSQTWTLADRTGTLDLIASNDFILNTSLSITSDTTGNPGDPSGAAGASINKTVGGLTVYAGRDIILNGSFSANYRVTGGAGGSSAALTWVGGNGGSVSLTRGAIDFTATRNILLNGSIGFYVRSDGGVGGQSTGTNPTQVGGNGGWASQVGSSASFTAGGDITVAPSASFTGQAEAHGGSAGAASPNASGGAGGFAVGNGMGIQFSAGGTFTQSLGSTMSTNAIGRGGHGSSFPAGGLGGGSGGGTATVLGSPITINAKNAILNGDISKAMSLQGGAAAPGSNGGSVSSSTLGNLQVNTSTGGGGNIILGGNINGTASLTNGSNSGSNTGGVASSSGSTFAFNADNDLIGNSATVNTPYTLFMSAGHSLLLNGGSLSAGNLGSQPLTLVADTAYPSSPNYGTGEIRLTGTSLIAANGVSIWGVSRALINLGSYTPSSWGTSPEWRGFPGFQPGVHCKLGCLGGTLTITADDKSMTYGDSAFPAFTASYAGFVNGDTASVVSGLQFNTTATLGSNVGTYVITPFGATAPLYYTLSYVNGTLTINPASLIVRVNDASKVYGAALPAFTTSVTGLVNGDSAASVVTANPTTGAAIGSNAGVYQIAPNAVLLSGNYVLSEINGTLTISAAPLTVTANDASRAYGDANPAFTTSATGLVNGDSAASAYKANPTTSATVGSNVGIYDIAPNAVLLSGNYVLSQVNGKLTITAATLHVAADDKSKVYGAALPALTVTVTGGPASAVSFAPTVNATAGSNVGSYTITPNATLNNGNYVLTQSNGTLTVTAAPLTITAGNASRTYGDANPAFTTSVTGLVNGDSATSVFTANPTTSATLGSNAGIYAIAPNAALLSGNYVLSQVNGKLTVNRAVLTVTADDASRVYGDGNPAFTTSASGFKNGDSAASIYKANPTTTASVGSNVGVYQLSPGAVLLSGNYVLSQVDGKLTITPAPLRFSVNDARRVYGSANPAFTSSLIGLRNGDSPNDVLSVAYRTDATRDSNVGNYNLNGTATLAGSKSGNYALLNPTSQALFTIDPATLTVRIVSASTVRGDTPGAVQRSSSDYNAQQPAGTIRYTTDYASQYGTTDTVKWTVSGFGGNDFTLTGAPGFAGDGVTSPLQATPGSVKTSSNYVLKFDFGNPANWLTTRNPTITVNIADLFALSQTVDYISPVFLFNGLRGTYASQNNLDLRGLFGGTAWSWSVNPFALDKMSILAHGPASGSIPGDPYGPYDFSYDPNGGLLQLVGVSPGVTQGLTKQQLLMTMGPGVPLLTKDGSPKVPINIPPFTPMIFGLPVVFTSQINDIVSAYLRGTGQPSTPGDANNWLMTRGNDPAAYGTILPYLMNWLQDYESRMAVSKDLAHLNALIASDAWRNPLFSWSYKISFLDPLAKRVGFSFIGSMVDIAAYATQLRDFIQSKYPSPTVADQGLYDYIMAKLQNDRITAADKAITAYKDWKREAEERKNNKMPTLMSLFDLGESPPDELIIAAQTGAGGFSGDPVALQQVLTAAGTTMAGFAGGGALAANLTNISVGIATNLARGITTSTTGAAAGAFTGPAIIITTALQVAVQGILKIAHDANFEKNLRKAADETRQSRSFTSLMHGEGGKGEAIAGATMASLAGLLSQGSSGGAYAAVSNPPISVIVDPMVLNPTPIQVRPNTIIVVPSSGGSPTPIQPPPPASSRPQISEPATGLRLQSLENKRTEIGPPTMIQLRGVPERKAPPSTLGPIEKQLMPTERPRPSYTDPNLRVVPTESVPEKQPQQPQKTAPASPQTQTPAPLPGHRLQSLTNKRK